MWEEEKVDGPPAIRSAQRPVEEAELDNLVDFINCLDEAESLPPVCVYASDLSTLPTVVIASTSSSPSELPRVDQSVQLNKIQSDIEKLSKDLKENWADIKKILKCNLSHAQSGGACVQAPQSAAPLLDVSSRTKVKPKLVDRSHNVIFEFAVGRKIELADCRRIGKYLQGQVKSRPLLVKLVSAWDRRLLLSTKFKLRGFTDAWIFLREDLAPEDRRTNNVKSKAVSGHLPSDITDECECMEKQLTMALNNHVNIVTYNARGFQSGSIFVKELLNDCDFRNIGC